MPLFPDVNYENSTRYRVFAQSHVWGGGSIADGAFGKSGAA